MSTRTATAVTALAEGRVSEALEIFREDAWARPTYASKLNYSSALRAAGRLDDAATVLWDAISLPDQNRHFAAWLNLGNVVTDLGKFDEAAEYHGRALRIAQSIQNVPEQAQRQIALAYACSNLRLRDFHASTWAAWEIGRFESSWFPVPGTRGWGGDETDCLLVVCEGGYGDAFLFSRWLPIAKQFCKRLKLMIWPSLIEWRDWRALGVDEVISKDDGVDPTGIDATVSWMSLPALFCMGGISNIPADDFPLKQFPGAQRIGFCWRAEESGVIRKVRSLDPDTANSIARALAHFSAPVSLCPRGKALYRAEDFKVPDFVEQNDALIDTWYSATAIVRECRLVVTIDSAIAHLAGLCGVPTLLLLPCASDWKWGTAANAPVDLWYGEHVHYYRETNPLGWSIENIEEAICRIL